MIIDCINLGKKYNKEWVLKEFSASFNLNDYYAINGSNGSGKSTFLKIISGFLTPSQGEITYKTNSGIIDSSKIYKDVSYCAPYIDIFDSYTIKELYHFYIKVKPLINNLSYSDFKDVLGLTKIEGKTIKDFSSGMRQRVKLALAIVSDTSILLMDEPTSNLDKDAIQWYQNLIDVNKKDRIVFVASNLQEQEYFFCDKRIAISDYKKRPSV